MTSNIQVFNYKANEIRTIAIDGSIWFAAKDVCDVLGLTNARDAISSLDEDERRVSEIATPSNGGYSTLNFVSESGVYSLVFKSRKPNAKAFRKWVTATVLPSIRQHGFYATPDTAQRILDDPDTFINVLKAYKEQKARNAELEAKNDFLEQEAQSLQRQINTNKPKVLFADAVDASKDSMLIGNFAKILKQNGIDIGQNRLFAWFREHGYLMNINYGERKNMPTQKSMEQGLFEVKKTVVNNPDGSTRITHTTKLTGKGQIYFLNIFVKERNFNVCV